MPSMRLSWPTTLSRRRRKASTNCGRKSIGPSSAATAAAWLIELVCEVDWDWTRFMALISSSGPAPKPTRQPVMA